MKYLSLFSGVGGFELGIQQVYESLCNADRSQNRGSKEDSQRDKGQRLQPKEGKEVSSKERPVSKCDNNFANQRPLCIGFSEIDKYATKVYKHHFPEHKEYGDITTINEKDLPDFDLLVGGFPCQSFSIAGKRGGFDDTRGTMFFEIARIVREKQPRFLLLENVKGLLSHDKGNTFRTIIATLNELGYDCQWQVLNSKNHGVPQNRERVFIIGHLRGTSRPEVFPFGEDTKSTHIVSGQCSNTLTARYYGGQANGTYVLESELDAQEKTVRVREATKKGYAEAEIGDSINLSVPNSKTRRGRVGKGVSQTLDTGMQQHTLQNSQIRRLTPTECERLQGFPDNWTNVEGMSDTQRYKQMGNAVTVNVIASIIKKMI